MTLRERIVSALMEGVTDDGHKEWCPKALDSYEDAAEVIATIVLRVLKGDAAESSDHILSALGKLGVTKDSNPHFSSVWHAWPDNMPLDQQVERLSEILLEDYLHTFDR